MTIIFLKAIPSVFEISCIMKKAFDEFKSQVTGKQINFNNNKFKTVFQKFYFYFINEEESVLQNINEIKNQIKLIVVDYITNESGNYYIICFDYKVFIIEESKLSLFQIYFYNNSYSKIYYLDESKKLNFCQNQIFEVNRDYLLEEIESFSNFSNGIVIKSKIESLNFFWSLFKKCLFCFLILKGYQEVRCNRITNYFLAKFSASKKSFNHNDYIQLRTLGSTDTSTVYLIFCIESEEIMAMKSFNFFNNYEQNDIYEREVNNYIELSGSKFPYFPRFFQFFQNKGSKHLFIEYIDGDSLDKCIKKFNFNEKIKILFEIMIAIQHLHNKKFVYRDLKLSNVIIDRNNIAVLIDFDRMIKYDEKENDDTLHTCDFNRNYSAPELGEGKFSYKSDVYSIGQMIQKMFLENNENIPKYDDLRVISEKCTSKDQAIRPFLSELIDDIYIQFFWPLQIRNIFNIKPNENIELLSEEKTIKSIPNIHSEDNSMYWIEIAEYDNPFSQLSMGYSYISGSIFPMNEMKAFHYYHISSTKNIPEAHYNIGNMYYDGTYVQKDIKKAIDHFEKASDKNFAPSEFSIYHIYSNDVIRSEALFKLGFIHYNKRDINKVIKYLSRAVELNHIDAMLNLANIYINCTLITKDVNKALYYYTLAADRNNEFALFMLGQLYLKGEYVKYDINKSISYFARAAEQNNVIAQINLGIIYANYTSKKEINKAIYYFKLASNQGNSNAQLYLGEIYRNKNYGVQDIQKAIHYFKLSASHNNVMAHIRLGVLYRDGIYFKSDFNKYFYHFMAAANLNEKGAQYEIGNIYYEGKYIQKDINKALHFFKKAADQNVTIAQYNVGIIYHYNIVHRDIKRAIAYYKKASLMPEASFQLSVIYMNDKFNIHDIKKGLEYLKYAASKKYPPALFNLGSHYYYVEKNIDKALDYLEMAAKYNVKEALTLLAIIYKEGIYTKMNISKSINYLQQASKLDHDIAHYILGALYLEGLVFDKNVKKAIYYLELASEKDNNKAYFLLGSIYQEGEDKIKKDINKSIYYYKKASNRNNNFAKNNLGVIYQKSQIGYSIELFEEAIKINNDRVAMLNLAKIYFYDETISKGKYKKDWISLLIESANQDYQESKAFLCVVLIKMIGTITIEKVEFEIQKHTNGTLKLARELYDIIKKHQMEKEEEYFYYFQFYKYNEFRYFTEKQVLPGVLKFVDISSEREKPDITDEFCEGFGWDLFT